jgi:hypothetical protein
MVDETPTQILARFARREDVLAQQFDAWVAATVREAADPLHVGRVTCSAKFIRHVEEEETP